jgi:hypothetical protein
MDEDGTHRQLTEASLAQNEEVKKISAWAAVLFAPTLVGTIYGMNFDHLPELHGQRLSVRVDLDDRDVSAVVLGVQTPRLAVVANRALVLAAGGNCFGQFGFVADRL